MNVEDRHPLSMLRVGWLPPSHTITNSAHMSLLGSEIEKSNIMNKTKLIYFALTILIATLLFPTKVGGSTALEDTGYEINWWTIDGGGGTSESTSGQYVLQGTIGQPDAGTTTEGGTYSLRGGFWVEGILTILEYIINLPLVLR
jgi:hypothetical protein